MCFTKCVRKVKRNFTRVKCGDQGSKVCDMWMCPTSPFQVSLIMFVVLMISSWSPIICSSSSSGGASDSVGKSFSKRARAKRAAGVIKIEVIAILADSTNASLSLSKALVRALNAPLHSSDSDEHVELSSPSKNFTFRVKNFVITNYSGGVESKTGSEGFTEEYESSNSNANQRKGLRKHSHQTLKPHVNVPFFPGIILDMCDFLRKTKAVAMVNTISDVASERLLSLVSSATTLPLIGSSQFADPLQTLYKSSDDFYINLSISVRHFARALGHFLIYCHWHTFTVLIDDSPSILSSQMIWEEELNLMQTSYRFHHRSSRNLSSSFFDYDEHKKSGDLSAMYEEEGGNDDDAETSPVLNPHFITLKTNNSNSAFRALSSVTKATQGVVVLLCSERSLRRIFESANQLGMLNGNYIFILVGQRSQFEVIPEWVPNGVLALRSPQKGGIGKQTMKRAGKLLSSAFHSVKNLRLLTSGAQQVGRGRTSDPNFITSIKTSTNVGSAGSSTHASSTPVFPATLKSSNPGNLHHPKEKSKPKIQDVFNALSNVTCWKTPVSFLKKSISEALTREMQKQMDVIQSLPMAQITEGRKDSSEELQTTFDVLNLIRSESNREWRTVGNVCVEAARVQLETIRWPAGGIFGPSVRVGANKAYRIVTITSPPFVMVAEADDNETCVKGLPCLKVETIDKDELALIFAEFDRGKHIGPSYRLACCDGLAMDLLASISRELKFEVDLFLVPDGYFGSRSGAGHWNGIMSALLSGSAHMSFAPISVTSIRANSVDFSTPFFFSGVSLLGMSKTQDVSLMAFLAPFSFELWAAIFITLNMTALAVALFEWLSPFGLNPWGRQRTKNFSMASALWVVWGRLFSHLVAFKAPKSWPNKFLINVWGGFSVIFVASYTANIAALFAGRFFERALGVHDRSLLSQRVAAVKHSATDFYIKREHLQLWEHIQKFPVFSFQQGVELLKNGSLDLLIGDGPLLDYYRGSDSSCSLIDVSDHDKIGDDTYAVAMTKGFPLKESISSLVAKYIGNGYMDYLQGKWYGQLLCFRRRRSEFAGAKALEVDAVYGMMIMLGIGTLVGLLILSMELIVYKYALPYFRKQPKGTLWRSPNIMFFSQKLYRFINSVELVSPHHAAKELVNTLRHGQITSLFQKSVKRKEHEQRRRRKSKAQFFEMIQEVRRVQKRERQESVQHVVDSHENERDLASPIYSIQARLESNKQTPKLIRVLGVDVDMPNKTFLTMPSRSSSIIETSGEGEGTDVVNQQPLSPPSGYTDSDNKHRQTTSKGRRKTTKILKRKPTESARKLKSVEFDLGGLADEDEELQVETRLDYSPESNGESECFSSPLDQTDLSGLSKAQVIQLWRDSESNLRRQLNDTLREREELTLKLDAITSEKPP